MCKIFFNGINNLLEELKINYQDKKILIVAHAGVMKAVECLVNKMKKDEKNGLYLPNNCDVKKYIL